MWLLVRLFEYSSIKNSFNFIRFISIESVEDFNDESDDKYSTKSVSYAKKSTAKSQLIQKLFS